MKDARPAFECGGRVFSSVKVGDLQMREANTNFRINWELAHPGGYVPV